MQHNAIESPPGVLPDKPSLPVLPSTATVARPPSRLGLETGSQKVFPETKERREEGGREKLVLFTETFALCGGGGGAASLGRCRRQLQKGKEEKRREKLKGGAAAEEGERESERRRRSRKRRLFTSW